MAPKLYASNTSPPCRSVYFTAEALGIKLDHTEITIENLDHLQTDFIKINPQHTIPTLDDDGKIIWDSHAINVYLVSKYGKDDSLYPKNLYERAVIDQRLHFDTGVLFSLLRRIARPMVFEGVKIVPENLKVEVKNAYEILEKFLDGRLWAAGDKVTLADFSLLPSVTTLNLFVPIDFEKFPNIDAWIKRGEKLPYYHLNQKVLDMARAFISAHMSE